MNARRELDALFPHQEGAQYWFRTPAGETSLTCSGLASRVPSEPVTPRTTFHCFSATKPITALAVLQLVSQGRLALGDPLAKHLPELPYRNGATVQQVLSHQAGLPSPMPLSWVHTDADHGAFDPAAFLDRVLRENSTCRPAGRSTHYSNIGFLLLGRLVEIISGVPYPDYVRTHILDPIGCSHDASDPHLGFDIPPGRHATGYTDRWSGLGLFISLLPDTAALRSSEGRWIKYRPFHLNGAAYGGLKGNADGWAPLLTALAGRDPRLLPREGYDAFFSPQLLASGKATGHALAWFTGQHAGHAYLCHAGGGPGYGAEIRLYPDLGAASVLLTNTTIVRDARLLDRLDAGWLK